MAQDLAGNLVTQVSVDVFDGDGRGDLGRARGVWAELAAPAGTQITTNGTVVSRDRVHAISLDGSLHTCLLYTSPSPRDS